MDLELHIDFEKSDPTGGYVRGFAYLYRDGGGQQVVDYSGQFIDDPEVLRDAAHDFMEVRVSKSDHGKGAYGRGGVMVGDVVESLVIDDDVAKALGMTDMRRGWFVGVKVDDAVTKRRIRNKELSQLSIRGRGKVEKLKEAA